MTQTVVITGASAGIGRAAARLFGQRGDRVALIARGRAGLEGAVRDVERAGGTALAVPADVTDFALLDRAAKEIEDAFGPIDVWVNVAFASVFAVLRRRDHGGDDPGQPGGTRPARQVPGQDRLRLAADRRAGVQSAG